MRPDSEQRVCRRKQIHINLENAQVEAKRMHKKHKAKYVAYQCVFCSGFHVGTDRSQQAAQRRAAAASGE